MTEIGHVDANLMRPTGSKAAFKQTFATGEGAFRSISGDGFPPFRRGHNRHLFPITGAASNVADDLTIPWRWRSPNDGSIGSLNVARLELCGKCGVCRIVLGNDNKAAGILVQPVHDAWPALATNA